MFAVAKGFISMLGYFLFLHYHQNKLFDADGNITPEERLWPAVPGGLFVPVGLFLYGWTTHLHWMFPVMGGSLFGIGMFTICKCGPHPAGRLQELLLGPDASRSYGYASISPRCVSCCRGHHNRRELFNASDTSSHLSAGHGPVLRVLWCRCCKLDTGRFWNTVRSLAIDTVVSRPEAANA